MISNGLHAQRDMSNGHKNKIPEEECAQKRLCRQVSCPTGKGLDHQTWIINQVFCAGAECARDPKASDPPLYPEAITADGRKLA